MAENSSNNFYISREYDDQIKRLITKPRVMVTILGPLQSGKSCLLQNTIKIAASDFKNIVFIDFRELPEDFFDSRTFFRNLGIEMLKELELDQGKLTENWEEEFGEASALTEMVENLILQETEREILFAFDNIDVISNYDYSDTVFGLIRAWYSKGSIDNEWHRIKYVLTLSVEPITIISNLYQSPFNVSDVIRLSDFTIQESAELNNLVGNLLTKREIQKMHKYLGGHPGLVKSFYFQLLNQKETRGEESMSKWFQDSLYDFSTYTSELANIEVSLSQIPLISETLKALVINKSELEIEEAIELFRLGLINEVSKRPYLRCELYGEYLRKKYDIK